MVTERVNTLMWYSILSAPCRRITGRMETDADDFRRRDIYRGSHLSLSLPELNTRSDKAQIGVAGPSSVICTSSMWMEKSLLLLLASVTRLSSDHLSVPVNRMLERFSHALWVTSSSIRHLSGRHETRV
ncbi:hypothetical protein EYF80_012518 [Liparis tanakae]|uniref:Uncharacterized protein n=1 Tax=Liparis tanakae TaxID=230148 RepID=A0A4Z2IHK0_9TELE|nr:hypothetical protein EYF80_012518 [Liparis tanakae]